MPDAGILRDREYVHLVRSGFIEDKGHLVTAFLENSSALRRADFTPISRRSSTDLGRTFA